MPLNVCFQAGPTSNCHTVPYELGNPMEKLCQGVKRGCSRYKIYVHVCVSITNHSTKRKISEGGEGCNVSSLSPKRQSRGSHQSCSIIP